MKKIIFIMISLNLLALSSKAQAPTIFNYQGVARNSVGNVLVNKAITLRLTIHDGSAAGPIVYQETRAVTTNPFGLFNVQMGSPGGTNVIGTIAGVDWNLGDKYIQTEIDPNGGTTFINVGTAQLASVPYSWYSNQTGDLVLPFNKSQADAGSLFKISNTGTDPGSTALEGITNSAAANASGIIGIVAPTSPGGFSSGVRGINNGTGGLGIGVYGRQDGTGWGVYGTTPGGIGVHGNSNSGSGVFGQSATGIGLEGTSASGLALRTSGGVRLTGINEGLDRVLRSDASGNATWVDLVSLGIVTGSGTLNFIPKWTPDGTTLGNSLIFDDGVNVGISTITPTARLNVLSAPTTGGPSAIRGESNSTDANAVGILGVINSTSPGGFSAALRGTNNGTGGLGIGVYGQQSGSGWGVYGTTPNGIGVHGNSSAGFGIYGLSTTGIGVYGLSVDGNSGVFEITNAANTSRSLAVRSNGLGGAAEFLSTNAAYTGATTLINANGIGTGLRVQLTNASNGGRGIDVNQSGVGPGVFATSTGGNAVWGITSSISAAGVIGDNTYGEAVVGRNRGGNGVGAVVGRNDSTGYGVRGFNTKQGIGVLGQAGISGGTGVGGRFENVNPANTSSAVEVANNGIGDGISIQLTNPSNGARGLDVLQAGVGPGVFATSAGGNAVWGITSSISAAGVIGDNTYGEAVVGRNRGGNGVGAVVGRNDSTGYGVRGFNTKDGIGVFGQAGISGGTGIGARFENVNVANPSDVLVVVGNGTGRSLFVQNVNPGPTDLAVFRKSGSNVARISGTGQIFANGGFTVGGADVAEYFEVEGERDSYEPGDVLVISRDSDRKMEKSSTPYSTLVSGVYATKPGLALTEENAVDGDLSHMVPMGVIGVIPTKVCLEGGDIKRGDLLVTSSIPGVAMKADLEKVRVGQVLGKALEDHNTAEVKMIRVLVSVK